MFTYGIEVKEYLARDMCKVNVAMNDGIRKIFGWNRWESVRQLRTSFGYNDIYTITARRRKKFMETIPLLCNPTLNFIKHFLDSK